MVWYETIENIGSELGIPEEVLDRAKEMYTGYPKDDKRGYNLDVAAAASVLVASREKKVLHTYREVKNLADESINKSGGMKIFVTEMMDIYDVEHPSPLDYINNRISRDLELDESEIERASSLVGPNTEEYRPTSSANIAAAAIYYYTDADAKREDLANSVGVTTVSTGNACEKIAEVNPGIAVDRLIDAYQELINRPDKELKTKGDFNKLGSYPGFGVYEKVFGTFEKALEAAGLGDTELIGSDFVKDTLPVEENIYRISEEIGLEYSKIQDAVDRWEEKRKFLHPIKLKGTSRQIAADAIYESTGEEWTKEKIAKGAN